MTGGCRAGPAKQIACRGRFFYHGLFPSPAARRRQQQLESLVPVRPTLLFWSRVWGVSTLEPAAAEGQKQRRGRNEKCFRGERRRRERWRGKERGLALIGRGCGTSANQNRLLLAARACIVYFLSIGASGYRFFLLCGTPFPVAFMFSFARKGFVPRASGHLHVTVARLLDRRRTRTLPGDTRPAAAAAAAAHAGGHEVHVQGEGGRSGSRTGSICATRGHFLTCRHARRDSWLQLAIGALGVADAVSPNQMHPHWGGGCFIGVLCPE